MKVLNKRSSELNEFNKPKTPLPEQLDYGEIGVNYAKGGETLTIKNSSNEIIQIGIGHNKNSLGEIFNDYVNNNADGNFSHAEGYNTNASGLASHAEGHGTIAYNENEHAEGKFNQSNNGDSASAQTLHSIGIGVSSSVRKNAIEVMRNGDIYINGIGGYSGNNYSTSKCLQSYLIENNGVGETTSEEGEIFNDYTNNKATKQYAHAEGQKTIASGLASHTEGIYTQAIYDAAHAEGNYSKASGISSHAEGNNTQANGNYSHAEGNNTQANGIASHAEGSDTLSKGFYSHAEGNQTTASGESSHAEGNYSKASGISSHAEGNNTQANGIASHAEGNQTTASGESSHAEGNLSHANGNYSHSEGYGTLSNGVQSHAEGRYTEANGASSHAEGYYTNSYGSGAHCEGGGTNFAITGISSSTTIDNLILRWNIEKFSMAKGDRSHCEGKDCLSLNSQAHAEGQETIAYSVNSHAEGYQTTAKGGNGAHAEGYDTIAGKSSTYYSAHAEGYQTQSLGNYGSHSEGRSTVASGNSSHAEGAYTQTYQEGEHAEGVYNKSYNLTASSGRVIHSIGIGTSSSRKNAVEVKYNGDNYITGIGGFNGTNSSTSLTVQEVINANAKYTKPVTNIIGYPETSTTASYSLTALDGDYSAIILMGNDGSGNYANINITTNFLESMKKYVDVVYSKSLKVYLYNNVGIAYVRIFLNGGAFNDSGGTKWGGVINGDIVSSGITYRIITNIPLLQNTSGYQEFGGGGVLNIDMFKISSSLYIVTALFDRTASNITA